MEGERRASLTLFESVNREKSIQNKETKLREHELELLQFEYRMKESFQLLSQWRKSCLEALSAPSCDSNSIPEPPEELQKLIGTDPLSDKLSGATVISKEDEGLMLLVEGSAKAQQDKVILSSPSTGPIPHNRPISCLIEPLSVPPLQEGGDRVGKSLGKSHELPGGGGLTSPKHKKHHSVEEDRSVSGLDEVGELPSSPEQMVGS